MSRRSCSTMKARLLPVKIPEGRRLTRPEATTTLMSCLLKPQLSCYGERRLRFTLGLVQLSSPGSLSLSRRLVITPSFVLKTKLTILVHRYRGPSRRRFPQFSLILPSKYSNVKTQVAENSEHEARFALFKYALCRCRFSQPPPDHNVYSSSPYRKRRMRGIHRRRVSSLRTFIVQPLRFWI